MVEVGVPVYNALETLPKLLDSLVAQTYENFIVCLSFDGDNNNYSNIINEYIRRGLHIRTIHDDNAGPGIARQRIIDTTQCDYIIFADADDMLTPRAVEVLYNFAKFNNFDIMRSNFIRESKNSDEYVMGNNTSITWCHGKIYKTSYLRFNDIRFIPELKTDEDAYFNLVAWNATQNKGEINEVTYIWRDNPNSLTRMGEGKSTFVKNNPKGYFISQLYGLNKIFSICNEINIELINFSFINLYEHYMYEKFLSIDMKEIDELLKNFMNYDWFKQYLTLDEKFTFLLMNAKQGSIVDNKLIFYKENIYEWINRIMRSNNESSSC